MSVWAPLKDKRVDTSPLRYAEPVALTCPGFLGSAAEPGHGSEAQVGPYRLINSYHCSRLNTNTGRLTTEMFEAVIANLSARLA